jgi:nitrate reductase NapE component
MVRRHRKSKKRKLGIVGIILKAKLLALATVALLGGAGFGFHVWNTSLVSATGIAVCNIPHTIVLVFRDGSIRRVVGANIATDLGVQAALKLPESRLTLLNLCPKAPPPKEY